MLSTTTILMTVSSMIVPAAAPSIEIDGQKLTARSQTVEVRFDGASITSVKPVGQDLEFIHAKPADPGSDLLYLNGTTLGTDKHQAVDIKKLSDVAARITMTGADSQRSLTVTLDPDTGDVRVTPDGISNRRGLRAVRWQVPIHAKATAILPVVNGMQFRSDQPHPPSRRHPWPFKWEAQLTIAQRDGWCMMIHCEDQAYQFKALQVTRDGDRTILGFESEPPGPLWPNRTAGGIEWRLNVYHGDWKVPADRYRRWMRRAYDLEAKRRHRPEWVDDISLAACWAGSNVSMLDALAEVHPPNETLIHLSNWRTEKYDVNYPDYTPSEKALEYMAKAREMGFHVMPHFNFFAVYYQHPAYQEVRDFQIRSPDLNEPQGWHWPPQTHDYTRMGYIHPGLGIWRNTLMDAVLDACRQTRTDVAFIDQTLCTWNTDNALVQGMNTIEGMRKMQEQFAAIRPGLVLVGEGLNEISFQRECFAQAHIFDGWGKLERKHVDIAHPINAFLWGDHTKLIGYYHLRPHEEGYELGIEIYERMNALPTIITNNVKDLKEMTPATKRIFDRAKQISTSRPAR